MIVNAVSTQRDQGTATTRESELATAHGYLELTGVSKSYSNRERASVIAIKDVDLAVREKEFWPSSARLVAGNRRCFRSRPASFLRPLGA